MKTGELLMRNKLKEIITSFDYNDANHILGLFLVGCVAIGIGIDIQKALIIVPGCGMALAGFILALNKA